MLPVAILGVHLKSDGYPNVTYRIQAMQASAATPLPEINYAFRTDFDTSKNQSSILNRLWSLVRFLYAHANVFVRSFGLDRRSACYIPYPGVLLLLLFSFVPRALRVRALVVDAFISIYDTAVNDRKLVRSSSVAGRLIRWVENRAYSVADVVVVDTIFSAQYFTDTFPSLQARQVVVLPLSIDESLFSSVEYRPNRSACHVIFLGTFVPLQGVRTIAEAAVLLANHNEIHFSIIGTGQTTAIVEEIFASRECGNIKWLTDWQNKEQVRSHIISSDICLGIFGDSEKTQRVWPFKNYHYMAIGRALITGDTQCAAHLEGKSGHCRPFLTVPCGDAHALAEAITVLAASPERRSELANASREFYAAHLSSKVAADQLLAILQHISTNAV